MDMGHRNGRGHGHGNGHGHSKILLLDRRGGGRALKSVGHYSIPEMELRGSQYVQWF
jgi:hypothetical protein